MIRFYAVIAFLLTGLSSYSQEATTASSGSGQTGNIILDWSVGELTLTSTVQNANLVFTQGLLQGKMVVAPSFGGIAAGELIVFPNPTPEIVNLLTGFIQPGVLTLLLYDAQGKLLQQSSMSINSFGNKTISLMPYANGVYMLHAVFKADGGDTRKQSYKIIKAK
ncbi:MAG: T9SS type A sorting domain-containing protein [Chitinophagaceae bacterium]|nr:MAG: T9SS type A sorting domain-containing protein [Chitinophagaceae bacterium]